MSTEEMSNSDVWTEINIHGNESEENPQISTPPSPEVTYTINICCCRCLKNTEVSEARRDLFGIVFDWFVDAAVGAVHLVQGAWIAGILTYFIVFYAGVIITFTNLSPSGSRNNLAIVKAEIWKMSKFYGILMYIPSFFPICSAKLRLFYAKQLKICKESDRKELEDKMVVVKDQALWDGCCESYFESVPQAILQIVLLFMPNKIFSSYLDYFPIASIFFALYGITMSPITVMAERHKDVNMGHRQRLTAYASNALKVFSCALFISSVLAFSKSDNWLTDVLWTCFSAIIVFALMDGPQIFKYELGKSYPNYTRCHSMVTEGFILSVTIASFYLWILSQILPKSRVTIRAIIVIVCYTILMFFYSAGLLLYRQKLDLYHSISANVLLNFYLGVKSWAYKLFTKNKDANSSKDNDVDSSVPL